MCCAGPPTPALPAEAKTISPFPAFAAAAPPAYSPAPAASASALALAPYNPASAADPFCAHDLSDPSDPFATPRAGPSSPSSPPSPSSASAAAARREARDAKGAGALVVANAGDAARVTQHTDGGVRLAGGSEEAYAEADQAMREVPPAYGRY